jgi:hypothetical protein
MESPKQPGPRVNRSQSFSHLLPASFQTKRNVLHFVELPKNDISGFLDQELNLQRLTDLHRFLWMAGRPRPPYPLHKLLMKGRDVVITEDLDTRLIWTKGRIFVKPLPSFLLDTDFWETFIDCPANSSCSCTERTHRTTDGADCRLDLRKRATGFLFSYTALVARPSDFLIAKQRHLLPEHIDWATWVLRVQDLLADNPSSIYDRIDRRFFYGDLRLSRLNFISYFHPRFFKGYMRPWSQYRSFWKESFTVLASATVLMVVVLTAMQVGLATDLQDNHIFRRASYGFTLFCIVTPLVAVAVLLLVFLQSFVEHLTKTRRYYQMRMHSIRRSARDS